jgi:predicted phage tail protein
MNERIQEFAQGQFARLDALEQNDQQRVQHLQARIAQFRNNINELEQQNVELRAQLVRLEGNIHQVQREAVQLQIDINETKKAIAERQSGWLGSLLTAVAVVGVCVFATWAIGAALPAGMTASVKPMVGGAGVSIGALF